MIACTGTKNYILTLLKMECLDNLALVLNMEALPGHPTLKLYIVSIVSHY